LSNFLNEIEPILDNAQKQKVRQMKIAILGAGSVGGTLGRSWAAKGHEVFFGVPNPNSDKVRSLLNTIGASGQAGTVSEAAAFSEVVVLATPWSATAETIKTIGDLTGKVVVDCTNPLKPDSKEEELALGFTTSGAEQVAAWAKGASVFKTLNQAGAAIMGNPNFKAGQPVMFVCGDDADQKPIVLKLVSDIGFDAVDAGTLSVARLLEPLAMLWIHLAFTQKMGRNFAFALIQRD
jgi:hypothetical protein